MYINLYNKITYKYFIKKLLPTFKLNDKFKIYTTKQKGLITRDIKFTFSNYIPTYIVLFALFCRLFR